MPACLLSAVGNSGRRVNRTPGTGRSFLWFDEQGSRRRPQGRKVMDEQVRLSEGTVGIEGQGFVRRRLGRGLSALLGGSPGDAPESDAEPIGPAASGRGGLLESNQIH